MGVFQSYKNNSYKNLTKEKKLERIKRSTAVDLLKQESEKLEEEICNRLPFAIMPIDFNDSVWSTIHEYHDIRWRYWHLRKDERMFVYHLGLANLAQHLPEVEDEYIIPFKQRLVYLQFGKDYPMLCGGGGLNFMLSYNQYRPIKPEKDYMDAIRSLISTAGGRGAISGFVHDKNDDTEGISQDGTVGVGIGISYRDLKSLTSQYIDGCIGLLADMTNPFLYKDGIVFDNIPDGNKTLGDFFDDYLTNNVNKKSVRWRLNAEAMPVD